MTPANLQELLTAALDGALTPAERKAVRRLLQESPEARKLFGKLQDDRKRLKRLPQVPAPVSVADNVAKAIAERDIIPSPPHLPRPARRVNWSALPLWINVATAAVVLVGVGYASYLYVKMSRDVQDRTDVIAKTHPENPKARPPKSAPNQKPVVEPAVRPEAVAIAPREVPEAAPVAIGPMPRVWEPYTGPERDIPEIAPLPLDRVRYSQIYNLSRLADDAGLQKRLANDLSPDELIFVDLFSVAGSQGLEAVTRALRARGMATVIDAAVQDRVRRKVPTEFVVFTEFLTPAEVASLLAALATEDQKSTAPNLDTVIVAPCLPGDLDRMGRILGVNLYPKPGLKKIDISKPLPEGTASQVAAALSKMGEPRGKTAPQAVAFIGNYNAVGSPAQSAEIRQFLEKRGVRKADARPLMMVIRTVPKG